MAKEQFTIIAVEQTAYWADGLLEQHGITAAFCYYLIRNDEATHICSFTPNSWAVGITNDFVYDGDNESAHEWTGDNLYEGVDSDYIGFVEMKYLDKRFIAESFEIEVPDDLDADGRETAAYHDEIWKQAEEAAHEFNCNGLNADICGPRTYAEWQAEQLAKRHAQNVKPLAGRNELPLFVAQAKREGIDTYDAAREAGLI